MPELPEVETIVRELRQTISGKAIASIEIFWHKSFQEMIDEPYEGQTIESIHRHGKYIIIGLTQNYLIVHLRMTGQLFFNDRGHFPNEQHLRIKIKFDNFSELAFFDQRKFGRIYFVADPSDIIGHVGPDALDSGLDEKKFSRLVGGSKMNIKAFLLSQKHISGVGNIYADESLFRCKIHPASTSEKIPVRKRKELFHVLRSVLLSAINNMGTTISDYRDVNGNEGKNQSFLEVYGQSGTSCSECGSIIIKYKIAGRGTHFCPDCQKIY